jgi:hypothetical protein
MAQPWIFLLSADFAPVLDEATLRANSPPLRTLLGQP